MSGRPPKSLAQLVRDGSFRARRAQHRALLGGPDLPYPGFAILQARFRRATSEPERRALALEFERAVRLVHAQAEVEQAEGRGRSLEAELAELGRPGSLTRLLRFFPHYLQHPKGPLIGTPFKLAAWQQRFLREFYRRDRKGRRIYRIGVLGVPRGNGKTPLAAGLGLYELVNRADAPEVYFAAASKEQAGIGLEFARSFVEQGPLADWVTVKSVLSYPSRRASMRVISADGRLQHGRAPAAAIVDELWALETAREQQTYVALNSALHKREDAYLLAITTAGYDKQSLLGRIYEAALEWELEVSEDGCLTIARDEKQVQLLWWYGAPEQADLEDERIWRAVNPASWIRLRDLRRQLHDPALAELEFRRLHLNQWTASREAWLPGGLWAALRSEAEIPEGGEIYVGVDIALRHDTSAVVWAHRLADGRIVLRCRTWSANEKVEAHEFVAGGEMRLELVEQFIRELGRRYRVSEVAYDPTFFARSAQMLQDERFTLVEFLPAGQPMADAYQGFYQACVERAIIHDGDPVLAAQVAAAAARRTERGWKLYKLKASQPFDACVAAVLAHARVCAQARRRRIPQIFWMETGW
jgi:phage terminase large subunit-like protein